MINNEKLTKIFEIFKELNKEQKLEYVINTQSENQYLNSATNRPVPLSENNPLLKNKIHEDKYRENEYKTKSTDLKLLKERLKKPPAPVTSTENVEPVLKSHQILVILEPKRFELYGNIKTLTKENLSKLLEDIKSNVDEEYIKIKLKIDEIKSKF